MLKEDEHFHKYSIIIIFIHLIAHSEILLRTHSNGYVKVDKYFS